MHKLVQQFATITLLCVLGLCAVSNAKADDPDSVKQARALFSQGVEHYDDGDYQLALDSFKEAYRLRPHPVVLVNIANCYDRLGRLSEAAYYFEKYLEKAESGASQRKEVEEALEQLYRKMGELLLTVVPDDSKVMIDDLRLRRSPDRDSIRLTAGIHDIKVSRKGYEPYAQQFELRKGEQFELLITLKQKDITNVAAAPVSESPQPPTEPEEDEEPSVGIALGADTGSVEERDNGESIFGGSKVLISAALTATFGISSLVCAVAAFGAEAQYNRVTDLARGTTPGTERDNWVTQRLSIGRLADNLWIATGFLFAGAVFSGGVLTYFFLSEKNEEEARLRMRPLIGSNGVGLTAVGGF